MRILYRIFLLFFFAGCANQAVPKGIISVDEMKKITVDLLRIDEYVNNFVSKDTTINLKNKRSIYYEQVFKLHNTGRKEFYTSYKYYQEHPDIQKTLFDSVLAVVERGKSAMYLPKPLKPAMKK